jgi:hypothetical protein
MMTIGGIKLFEEIDKPTGMNIPFRKLRRN